MRRLVVETRTVDGSTVDRLGAALGSLGHEVRTGSGPRADLLLSDRVPVEGEKLPGEIWVAAEALGELGGLAEGGHVPTLPSAVSAVLCPDATWQGLLDARGDELASRTRGVWGDPSERAARLVERAFPAPDERGGAGPDRPLRVVVAGHDLNFFRGILDHLQRRTDIEVRVDHVRTFAGHDTARSTELLAWADTAFCEWLSPVAAWYSHHKPEHVRLVVRLHRMELYNDWTEAVDITAIDEVVCVSPHYVRLTLERTGWPTEKVTCVPNYVDCDDFDRPKLPGAEHHLGFVGMVPSRKRFDLALDVVERLRDRDPRYRLFVKTKMPWEYPWNWREPAEREITALLLDRVAASPLLRDGVVFDPAGPDVGAWLRRVGHVLSTSDDESFHLAPAEGMASGAVPAIRDWPGSDMIYNRRWIHPGLDAMADAIDELVRSGSWVSTGADAQAQVRSSFDLPIVARRIVAVLRGDDVGAPDTESMSVPVAGDGAARIDPAGAAG